MNIEISTDHSIQGSAKQSNYIKEDLEKTFKRYESAITRLEVHLSDVNSKNKGLKDKRCLIEARVSHHQPIAVSHLDVSIGQALDKASDKLLRKLDNLVAKQTNHTGPKNLLQEKADELEGRD